MQTAATDFPYSAPRIEIAATFTASPLEAPLRFWLGELSLPYQLNFAPYQQLFQSLLDPAGGFAANQKGANVVLFRLEDLTADDAPLSFLEQHSAELRAAVRSAAGRSSAPFLVCLCPASARFLKSAEHAAFAAKEQDLWRRDLAGAAHVFSISAEEAIERYQVEDVGDEHADRMGHIPYHSPFFVALATQILRAVLAFDRKPVKVIALDCDNTLWSGVCGEDGPKGVVVDEGRLAFQRFLLRQRDAGILLVLASKNNEADVRETFDTHPEMLLRWNDIVAHRVNWDAKSQNLLELASELNLGLDSIVFFDDDAKECAEVSEELPEVLTFQIPHDPDQLPRFLDHLWVFDRVRPLTSEDRERPKLYAEQTQRNRFEKQAADLKEFLAGLQLEVVFEPVNDATLARVAQLTQRTNQMNTTLRRYTQGELAAVLASGDIQAFTVTVSDRFGSYGLVGAVLFHLSAGTLDIDGFLLSCRGLGRGVEHRMLRQAAAIASQEGKRAVRISLVEGPRNRPALDFIHSLSPSSADGHPMEFPVEALAHLELLTGSVARPVSSSDRKSVV